MKVQIVNPQFVIRVGYPMSYNDAYKFVEKNYSDAVQAMIEATVEGPPSELLQGFSLETAEPGGEFKQILGALARLHMKAKSYGGPERTIHTVAKPELFGKVYEVIDKQTCKTGIYDSPWSKQDHNGEWDCYSGGLINCKTHKILRLRDGSISDEASKKKFPGLWIEDCNVKICI